MKLLYISKCLVTFFFECKLCRRANKDSSSSVLSPSIILFNMLSLVYFWKISLILFWNKKWNISIWLCAIVKLCKYKNRNIYIIEELSEQVMWFSLIVRFKFLWVRQMSLVFTVAEFAFFTEFVTDCNWVYHEIVVMYFVFLIVDDCFCNGNIVLS